MFLFICVICEEIENFSLVKYLEHRVKVVVLMLLLIIGKIYH